MSVITEMEALIVTASVDMYQSLTAIFVKV